MAADTISQGPDLPPFTAIFFSLFLEVFLGGGAHEDIIVQKSTCIL